MRRIIRSTARVLSLLAVVLLVATAPARRLHAAEGGNSDTDVDDDSGVDMPSGQISDPDEIQPPDAKPRAHDEIPFPDAKPRPHDEIQPPNVELPQ